MNLLLLAALAFTGAADSPPVDTYPKNYGIDALNYAFRLDLSDNTDEIRGEATIDLGTEITSRAQIHPAVGRQ